MPSGDTFHGFLFWFLFWITGIGPILLLLYTPIGVAWIIGCVFLFWVLKWSRRP